MQIARISLAEEPDKKSYLFRGEVNADDINIRADSTASAEIVCKINKGAVVEVISELYGWYKIELPADAPSFINKNLLSLNDDKTAEVAGDNINIRLRPDTSSPILGRVNKGQAVKVLEEKGDWCRIEPSANSHGWIHKNFVNRIEKKSRLSKDAVVVDNHITVEGLLKQKTFTRVATHKLITEDSKVYLLKSDKENLDSFNRRRVKISGQLVDPAQQAHPVIEVEKIEALD
jgi:uncharacterized protein YgiM (DUF1202 family)